MNERVKIEGFVSIWEVGADGKKTILVDHKPNHFVDQGLKGLLSAMLCAFVSDTSKTVRAWSYDFATYLGKDTVTPTTHNLTALADPIGTAPGTAPNAAQWNPGTVSGTVSELALYLRPFTAITASWSQSTTYDFPRAMISRLSVADGDFTGVAIDISKSFVVHWEIQISFT
jgi:hypothetical protein